MVACGRISGIGATKRVAARHQKAGYSFGIASVFPTMMQLHLAFKEVFWPKLRRSISAGFFLFLVMPSSTTYELQNFGFGGGGVGNTSSNAYSISGISGEASGGNLIGATYNTGSGLFFTNQADVPGAPTFTNPSNYYNKLKIVLDTGGNPTDTKFAIAISTDDFITTNYVQSDNTVGATLGTEDYQTYTAWGGATGVLIIGLTPNTTYKVKVKAMQGAFTETGYGAVATAATVGSLLTFDIDVSATDSDTDPPFTTNFGNLIATVVTDSPQKIWVDFTTNGESGGKVYVSGTNAGLLSQATSYTIDAVSGNLTALAQGFGAQGQTATQSSGGPFSITATYDQTGNTVGITDQTIRDIFTTANPITGGRASFLLKAKASAVTPAAPDYSETLTVIASASF